MPRSLVQIRVLSSALAVALFLSSPLALSAEKQDSVKAHVELGVSYFQAGRFDVAQEEALAALKERPSDSDALTLLGSVHWALKEAAPAEAAFRKAISSNSSNANAQNNLGLILCQTGRIDEGIENFGLALATPRYPKEQMLNTLINSGICLSSKPDYPAAERYFLKALEQEPFHPPALFQLANLYYKTNRYPAASSRLEALHKLTRPTAATLLLQAKVAQAQGNTELARDSAQKILLQFPDSPEAKTLR